MLANEVAWIAGVVKGIARRGLKLDSTSQDPSPPHLPPRQERACLRGGSNKCYCYIACAYRSCSNYNL